MDVLRPSPDSALILSVRLPAGLEALRRRHVADAADGVPAHVTLLYPFAEPASIEASVLDTIGVVVGRHGALVLTLGGPGRWPDTLYATVAPRDRVRLLQSDLAEAFPSLPIYGGAEPDYEPHVTIVEGPGLDDESVAQDPAWGELPVEDPIAEVALIVRAGARWATTRTFALASGL